jgi:hypothetical protein
MEDNRSPKLRTVDKVRPPFPLNEFPADFPYKLGQELVYLLATKDRPDLEGTDWEIIFSRCVDAEWKPSNVGLDDVVLGNMAWSAKSVKAKNPSTQKKVRLVSGRNSPGYSFGEKLDTDTTDPETFGKLVLEIWNERVSAIREIHKHLRTVVLMKSDDLTEVVVFEFDTIRYDPELFRWEWNKNKNLCGFSKKNQEQYFTWQPHGSQFTIHEDVPDQSLVIRIKRPEHLDKEQVLSAVGFDKDWVSVEKRKS